MGVNSTYNEQIAQRICDLIASTPKGLDAICKENPDIPKSTAIYNWIAKYPDFAEKYARAKELQCDVLYENMDKIAEDAKENLIVDDKGRTRIDPAAVQLARLKIDTVKWGLSKLKRKKYGNEIAVDTSALDDKIQVNINLGKD